MVAASLCSQQDESGATDPSCEVEAEEEEEEEEEEPVLPVGRRRRPPLGLMQLRNAFVAVDQGAVVPPEPGHPAHSHPFHAHAFTHSNGAEHPIEKYMRACARQKSCADTVGGIVNVRQLVVDTEGRKGHSG